MLRQLIFQADYLRVKLHLRCVEMILRARDTSNLASELQSVRVKLLDSLHNYWQRGEFPHNTALPIIIPCFIDDTGRHCAVAHLMRTTGADETIQQVATLANYARVKHMRFPELAAWAERSGITKTELALIQPSYCPNVTSVESDPALGWVMLTYIIALLGFFPVAWLYFRWVFVREIGRKTALVGLVTGGVLLGLSLVLFGLVLTDNHLIWSGILQEEGWRLMGFRRDCEQVLRELKELDLIQKSSVSYLGISVTLLLGTIYMLPYLIRGFQERNTIRDSLVTSDTPEAE